ncbi:hypothetical protein BKA64DRAFT_659703 [Cadophora sp. MPI-SDFR-AT-0126]|nr:hypothetical protein BKA64DRAFT_659703 [Leotiomycetes sp. MPI-SDFR-AT-0126]
MQGQNGERRLAPAMNPTDPLFSKLPSEVLLQIVKQVPGLPSFRNIDRASPTISSLFDEFGTEIVESIISTKLPAQVQSLIRTIVLIQTDLTLTRSLQEFSTVYLKRDEYCGKHVNGADCVRRFHPSLEDSSKVCEACREAFPPIGISRDTSPVILRNILDSACQNQNITEGLLQSCLDRSLALTPLQLGQKFRYIPRPNFGRCPQRRPIGKRFTPESSDPFSWTERQRTSRQIWRVQLFFYLKLKTRDLHWPIEDIAHLESLEIHSFWELSDKYGRFNEQLGTVVYYLANTEHQHGNDTFDHKATAQALYRISSASSITRTTWDAPSSLDHHILDQVSKAEDLVQEITRPTHCVWGPLRYYDLGHWRNFGFYIWDDARMHSLGFLFRETFQDSETGGIFCTKSFSKDDMWFRWESVLSQHIIEANERRRLAEFPDGYREFGSKRFETWWSTGMLLRD